VDQLDVSSAPSATDTQAAIPRTKLEIDALGSMDLNGSPLDVSARLASPRSPSTARRRTFSSPSSWTAPRD
jgi:hypothetical protein